MPDDPVSPSPQQSTSPTPELPPMNGPVPQTDPPPEPYSPPHLTPDVSPDPRQNLDYSLGGRAGRERANQNQPPLGPPLTPAQANTAQQIQQHHSMLGSMMTTLMGKQVDSIDPNTGEIKYKKETPGQYLRGILAGALLGMQAGLKAGKEGEGVLGGIAAGGVAGLQSRADQDKEQMAAAKDQFERAQGVVKEARAKQTFTSEQEERKAVTARAQQETIKIQQEMKDHDFNQLAANAERDKVKAGAYNASGIDPVATGVTHDQMDAMVKANPKVVHFDWLQTGVKTVMVKDAQGNTVADRVPTFDVYDSDRKVTVNDGLMKLVKDTKLDDVLPGTTDKLKVGTELTPVQFQTLMQHLDAKHAQDLHDQTVAAENGQRTAAGRKDDADALAAGARAARDKATAKNLTSKPFVAYQKSLDAWNAAGDGEEGFAKLGKQDKMNIVNMLPKVMDEERKIIDSASKEMPPDQSTMDNYKSLLDYNGRLFRIASQGTKGLTQAGEKPPQDVLDTYLAKYKDPAKAQAAYEADKAKGTVMKPGTQEPGLTDYLKKGAEAIKDKAKQIISPPTI